MESKFSFVTDFRICLNLHVISFGKGEGSETARKSVFTFRILDPLITIPNILKSLK